MWTVVYGLRRFRIDSNPHGKNNHRSLTDFSLKTCFVQIYCILYSLCHAICGRSYGFALVSYGLVNTLLVLLNVCVHNQSRYVDGDSVKRVTATVIYTNIQMSHIDSASKHELLALSNPISIYWDIFHDYLLEKFSFTFYQMVYNLFFKLIFV